MDGFDVLKASIPANHMNMAKFSSRTDLGYQRVSGHIVELVTAAGKALTLGERQFDTASRSHKLYYNRHVKFTSSWEAFSGL